MKYNKIENKLKFDYNNMMASYIGENGFTEKDLAEMNAPAKAAFNFVSEKPRKRLDGLDGTSLQPERNRRRYFGNGKRR
ncbi:MAG: hypothetical protein L6V79_06035 [Clostridium sp.]|nr:MAG: hypothetical protein L6V79_06035 [Clostridium sp.]